MLLVDVFDFFEKPKFLDAIYIDINSTPTGSRTRDERLEGASDSTSPSGPDANYIKNDICVYCLFAVRSCILLMIRFQYI